MTVTTLSLTIVQAATTSSPDPDTNPLAWQDRGLCRETDPEIFYPEKGISARDGRRVCAGCEVRAECLSYALANGEDHGIWGATTPAERREIRKSLNRHGRKSA